MLNDFNNKICDKQDEYMPSGPPMSPITKTFFSSWMALDALINEKFTLGLLFSRYIQEKKVMGYAAKAMDNLNDSFVSLYQVVGGDLKKTILWDIVEKREIEASIPIYDYSVATYSPAIGEVWYARILPPLNEEQFVHTVLGTPLIFRHTTRDDWEGYLSRRIAGKDQSTEGLKKHFKHGDTFGSWLEFVLQTYVNHTREVIFAQGLPDINESRTYGHLDDGGRISGMDDALSQFNVSQGDHPKLYLPQSLNDSLKKLENKTCVVGAVSHGDANVPIIAGSFSRANIVFCGLEHGPVNDMQTKFRYIDTIIGNGLIEVCLYFKNNRILAFDFDPMFPSIRRWLHDVLVAKQFGFCFFNSDSKQIIFSLTRVNQEDEEWLKRNIKRSNELKRNNFKRILSDSQMHDRDMLKGTKLYCIGIGENEDCFIGTESKLIELKDI